MGRVVTAREVVSARAAAAAATASAQKGGGRQHAEAFVLEPPPSGFGLSLEEFCEALLRCIYYKLQLEQVPHTPLDCDGDSNISETPRSVPDVDTVVPVIPLA